jgi:hypothetical protein
MTRVKKAGKTAKTAAAGHKLAAARTEKTDDQTAVLQALRRRHKRLAIVYIVQAAIMLLLVHGSLAVSAIILGSPQGTGGQALVPVFHELFQVSIAQLIALWLAISAVFHMLQATQIRGEYEGYLKLGESPYRWLENAITSSLLPLTLGLVAGLRDIGSLIMLFALGFVAQLLGWLYERQLAARQQHDAERSYVLMTIASLSSWLVVGLYMLFTALYGSGVRPVVVLAYATSLLLVLAQARILHWRLHGIGRWADYLYTERTLIMLNFVAKSLLAWQILSITL